MKLFITALSLQLVTLLSKVFAFMDGKTVAEVSAEQIRELQSNPGARKVVLVDVRSEEEISVSKIPDAMTRDEFESSFENYRDHVVIAYCTIGGRSLLYARQLSKRGVDSRNFKSGIIGWCEARLQLQSPEGSETRRVHTYSSMYHVPSEFEQITSTKQRDENC